MAIFYNGKTFETMDEYIAFKQSQDAEYESYLAGKVPAHLEPVNEVTADAPTAAAEQTNETESTPTAEQPSKTGKGAGRKKG